MKYTYLLILFFSVIFPFAFSFHSKIRFDKFFKAFIISNLLSSFVFVVWDILFTSIGVWGFNRNYVLGIYVLNLPIEEILFFISIPFSCLFTYHVLNTINIFSWKKNTEKIIVCLISIPILIIGTINISKAYTASALISTGIFLLVLEFVADVKYLPKVIFVYLILLIPFSIVNGILTGSFLLNPVVWYNASENLGIRLGTIPVEDVFYGFELILLNVFFYELLKEMFSRKEESEQIFN